MIVVKKNKFGLLSSQKWFPQSIRSFDCLKITMYKQVDINIKAPGFFIKELSYTLHNDLTINEDEILKHFSSTIKNEIRRADREGNTFIYNENKNNFLMIFNAFALQKGIASQSVDSLNVYGNNLILTSTSISNIITAVHSYIVDFDLKKVRLLHSATQRFSENLDKSMIARSNKYLHFMDMKKFKNDGFEIYDWGGISFGAEDISLKGINNFKEQFGGVLIKQYNLYSPLYYLIIKLFK